MPTAERSWLDYANFLVAILLGVIGIGVAIHVARSADRISRSNLLVTMATFLLDESPKRQSTGVDMAQWAFAEYPQEVPEWAKQLISNAAKEATATTAGAPLLAPSTSHSDATQSAEGSSTSADPTATRAANRLFASLGGALPRVYIQVNSDAQRAVANKLRDALNQTLLNGDPVVVPKIQKVPAEEAPRNLELRYLKVGDDKEARKLADLLSKQVHLVIEPKNLSSQFDSRNDIKPRTYELWFPKQLP
jgi:hypothetical protein